MTDDGSTVRVAVRIRPQLPREVIDMCRVCTSVTPNEPQVTLGSDKSFTYDYAFDTHIDQSTIYDTCARTLVQGSLEGYNATVLAYGQTGSGKTYTMGTGFDVNLSPEEVGIIPRAIHHLFNGIDEMTEKARERGQPPPQFKISAQFLELYNEEIIDLFDPTQDYSSGKGKSGIKIHEDSNHCIYVTGVKSERIGSAEEALKWLKQGALSRTTASTQMNSQSSRSHAIFTLHIKQQRLVNVDETDDMGNEEKGGEEFETLTAKFHFVDLAGSERLKRTGATGERAKEGISINCGLLALGNVISALGDVTKKVLHVPYRDSKLTRLLQDSLGGNSRTLMIACVSPCDRDFMETLNTMKYANRARNIQNKVFINQDKSSRTIALLKKEIQQLQLELLEYKQGKRVVDEDGIECVNDMFHENTLLQNEVDNLRTRVKGMQETIESLSSKNSELLAEKAMSVWINSGGENSSDDISQMIKGYMIEIEGLRAKLLESENICGQLRKTILRNKALLSSPMRGQMEEEDSDLGSFLEQAKKGVQKESELLVNKKINNTSSDQSDSDSESSSSEAEEMNEYSSELASLNSEIIVKQKLIEELEKAQKRLNSMKQHYEDKLNQLQAKILATQQERDTVLASLSNKNKQPTDKIKKIKDEYEKKISEMQKEMKSLQSAKKEHATLLKNQRSYENQIKSLNSEVMDMKRTKVKLMNKMKDEAAKHKEAETRRNREIAKLKKQSRMDANLIRNLEAEKRAKAAVLKRKQEEVTALRRVAKFRQPSNSQIKGSPKVAKQRWIALEKSILESAMNKQSLTTLEKDMERQMETRKELQEELKSKMAMLSDPRFHSSSVIKEEIDTIEESLEHIQTTISDIQNEIIQVEEVKIPFESGDLLSGIRDVSEAAYILDKLYSMALNQSCLVAQKEVAVRELEAEADQLKKEGAVQEQLLKHLVGSGLKSVSPASEIDSSRSSRSSSPTDNKSMNTEVPKYRRRTALPQELLFPSEIPPVKGSQSALASPELMPPPPPLTRSLTTFKEQGLDSSPPSSPPVYRRQTSREENVFNRLTSQPAPQNFHRPPGKISHFNAKRSQKSALYCTHVVEGHNRAVLALEATDDHIFTASIDRTVVMWDLREMREVQCFFNHPNNVVAVKYDPLHRTLFSASASCCKVWDVRVSKCVKTLSSSGLTSSFTGQSIGSGNEPQMNAIALSHKGQTLYTAAGDRVRVWDLRKFSVVGKLVGGHQAAVMCMAIEKGSTSQDVIITGSKDHYIKVFDVYPELGGSISPRVTLEPPHYDGIQCLAIKGSALFSGSRDCIIKKWSLDHHELLLSLNGAHKDWVTGLCFSPCQSMLLSSSRDGTVRVWSTDTCTQLANIKAHATQINCITSNSSHVFTAASKGEVKMWKHQSQLTGQQDIMTMSTGHIFQLSV